MSTRSLSSPIASAGFLAVLGARGITNRNLSFSEPTLRRTRPNSANRGVKWMFTGCHVTLVTYCKSSGLVISFFGKSRETSAA
jgi:hypothetical protein